MSDTVLKINIPKWVDRAKADDVTYLQRQATEIILHAITMVSFLKDSLYLKGGVLMGIVYDSPRQTSDIDFSFETTFSPDETTADSIKKLIDPALQHAAAKLGYADIVIRFQSVKGKPHKVYPKACFPSLTIKIGYAKRHSAQEKKLCEGKASNTIELDISFKEEIGEPQVLEVAAGQSLLAYSLIDLIAEKYRAILQQTIRNRARRQDVYDLDILIKISEFASDAKTMILETFIKKCKSRGFCPASNSIDDPEIKKRSRSEWNTLKQELEEVPDFDSCFERVATFYRQLPWPEVS